MSTVSLRRADLLDRPRLLQPWTAVAWLLVLAVLGATAPDRQCPDTGSCADSWLEGFVALPCLFSVVVIALLPRWAALSTGVSAAVLGIAFVAEPESYDVPRSVAGLLLGLVVVNLVGEVDARRARVAPRHVDLGDWVTPALPERGGVQRGWGLGIVALAAVLVAISAVVGIHEHDREASARVEDGTVTLIPYDDSNVLVTVGETTHRVEVTDSADYETGEVDSVFVDAHGPFRMTAQPFSAQGGVYSSLVLGSVGVALVLRGRRRRRDDRRANAGPRPRFMARVALNGAGLVLFEPDDLHGARGPIAQSALVTRMPAPVEPALVRPVDSWLTRPAHVYGEVRKGEHVVVRTAEDVFVTQAPLRTS